MTYFKRKDVKSDSWSYRIMYKGKVYRGTLGELTKTRAKEMYEKIRVEIREGKHDEPKAEDPYLRDFVPEYFAYYKANRKKNSVDRHEYSWVAIQPVFGHQRLSEITPRKIERYRQARQEIGRSNATVNRELAFLRNVFSMAIEWGQAEENPVKRVKQAREDNSRTRHLDKKEEGDLLKEMEGRPIYYVTFTAIHTGMRRSELLSLKWANVDFENRLVTVEAGYSKNHEARSIPMSLRLTETLEEIRVDDLNAPVFLNSLGKPYREVKRAFNSAVKRAGIENFVFHDLRHTFASRLVMAGVDLATVKELLGHKTIAITMRYAHLSSEHRRSAIAVFDE